MLSITATVVGGAGGIWARPNPWPPPPWLQVCTSSVVTNMSLLLSKSFGGTVDRYSIVELSAAFLQLLSLSVRALGESSTDSWSLNSSGRSHANADRIQGRAAVADSRPSLQYSETFPAWRKSP